VYLSILLLYLWVGFCALCLFLFAIVLAVWRRIRKKRGKKTKAFTVLIAVSLAVAIPWGGYFVAVPADLISYGLANKNFRYEEIGNAIADAIQARDAAALARMCRKDLRRSVHDLTGKINAMLNIMQGEPVDCTLEEQQQYSGNGDQNLRGIGLRAATNVTEYSVGVSYAIRGGTGIDSIWIYTSDEDFRPQVKYEITAQDLNAEHRSRWSGNTNTAAVKLIAKESRFDNFRVEGDTVFFDSTVTLQNLTQQPRAVQMIALPDRADCFCLITGGSDGEWVSCYDTAAGAPAFGVTEFTVPPMAKASFQITFEAPYAGTPRKANRLLPILRLLDMG
jgi:hypothetical protein